MSRSRVTLAGRLCPAPRATFLAPPLLGATQNKSPAAVVGNGVFKAVLAAHFPCANGNTRVGTVSRSVVTDCGFPIPPAIHLAGAISRAPESITIIALKGNLVTQVVVGCPGPVLPIFKSLWSWTTYCSAFCLLDKLFVWGLQAAPGACGSAGSSLHRVRVEARGT